MATSDPSELRCTRCGEAPSISRRERRCRACVAEYKHAWNLANKEHVRRKNAEKYIANRERIKAKTAEWKAANPERVIELRKSRYERKKDVEAAQMARYREANRERLAEAAKARIEANPEIYRERSRRYARENSARIVQRVAEYKRSHPEKAKAWTREYQQRHPETGRLSSATRRARMAMAVTGDAAEIRSIYKSIHQAKQIDCHWCGRSVPTGERHVDHIMPIAKGGAHAPENLCCSCARCNLTKSAKLPDEFRKSRLT